jgi:hypothetical protein
MPIPNHCAECDKPLSNEDGWLCELCKEKEKIITSNKIGEDLSKILPSMKDEKTDNSSRR